MHIQRWLVLATAILGMQACRSPAPLDSNAILSDATDALIVEAPPVELTDKTGAGDDGASVERADLWETLRAGFQLTDDLPLDQPRFARALAWVTNQNDLISATESRARLYLPYLVQQVQDRGMPLEIALLPFVESTLDPYAASPQGAAGLWQLIPSTARHYGVSINWWYDGRRDLVDSTDAALDYLQALHAELGDWLLVVAAYNCGERRILRGLARNKKATFWDIDLPAETAKYVPRLLALAALIRTPEAFGADLPPLEAAPTFAVSRLDQQIDLALLAASAEIPLDDIFRLNPGLNHSATPPGGPHRVLLPLDHLDTFESAVSRFNATTPRWTSYKVKRGDTLGRIASRHGTTVSAIREANTLKGHLIHTGDTLVIPTSRVSGKLASNPLLQKKRYSQYYRVASGDSLWSISRRLGVTIGALVRANHLDPKAPLSIGQRLSVPSRTIAAR